MTGGDMTEAAPSRRLTSICRQDRHKLCGGYKCTCACHGPDHDPDPPQPTWQQVTLAIFGECINHRHTQVGPCVYCMPCGRRLYQGTVIPPGELEELRAALREAPNA